ncbi:MAG: dephospho-CoA kinase [Syntrophales bacterium]
MLNAGLTGGIASGKSTVSGFFREKGAYIIDHDTIGHRVEEPGSAVWEETVRHFGRGILRADGTLNREKLGDIVFGNPDKLLLLNRIVQPSIFAEWMRQVSSIEKERPDAIIISDVPLLIEAGWQDSVDAIILVYIPPEEQIRRLMERNGYSRDEAGKRLDSQMPIDRKVPFADFVIDNSGSLERTREQTDRIWTKLVDLEKKKRNEPVPGS